MLLALRGCRAWRSWWLSADIPCTSPWSGGLGGSDPGGGEHGANVLQPGGGGCDEAGGDVDSFAASDSLNPQKVLVMSHLIRGLAESLTAAAKARCTNEGCCDNSLSEKHTTSSDHTDGAAQTHASNWECPRCGCSDCQCSSSCSGASEAYSPPYGQEGATTLVDKALTLTLTLTLTLP